MLIPAHSMPLVPKTRKGPTLSQHSARSSIQRVPSSVETTAERTMEKTTYQWNRRTRIERSIIPRNISSKVQRRDGVEVEVARVLAGVGAEITKASTVQSKGLFSESQGKAERIGSPKLITIAQALQFFSSHSAWSAIENSRIISGCILETAKTKLESSPNSSDSYPIRLEDAVATWNPAVSKNRLSIGVPVVHRVSSQNSQELKRSHCSWIVQRPLCLSNWNARKPDPLIFKEP